MTAIVDYSAGNARSVGWALDRLGAPHMLTADGDALRAADRVILPGVGAAGSAMAALRARGLADVLRALDAPLLGVCLGLQLLYERSEEDDTVGLGLFPGAVRHFPDAGVPVPHTGWNTLAPVGADAFSDPLLSGVAPGAYAYFVHSYAAPVGPETVATTTYAGRTFGAAVAAGRVRATQFHPEKSAAVGSAVLGAFLRL